LAISYKKGRGEKKTFLKGGGGFMEKKLGITPWLKKRFNKNPLV